MTSSQTFHVQEHSANVLTKLNSQRSDEEYCDVVLQVNKRKFSAHRNVLAASSEYFQTMFRTNMKEKHEKIIPMKGVTPDAVESVLEFLYTEKITLTEENVTDILQAASITRIIDLLDVIVKYLSKALHTTNCLYFRDLGRVHSLKGLIEEADNCIIENFEDVALQPGFLDLQLKDVEILFSSDYLTVQYEKDVYEAVLKWVKKDFKERKKLFPDLFKLVRLQHIPIEYLSDKIRKEPLVREFHECRDLVEDAFFFRVDPGRFEAQKLRKGEFPDPDSIIMFDCYTQNASIFNITNKNLTSTKIPVNRLKQSSAVATRHQTTVFCGGTNQQNQVSNEVIIFNGTEWKQMKSKMNSNRKGAAAVYVKDILFVFGGENVNAEAVYGYNYPQNSLLETLCKNFEKHPGGNKPWQIVGNLLTRRTFPSAVAIGDQAYLIGGYIPEQTYNNYAPFQKACSTVEVFDTKSEKFSSSKNMNEARAQFGATGLGSRIYVVGGLKENNEYITSTEFMDTANGAWTTITTTLPQSINGASICCVKNNIYLASLNANGNLLKLNIPSKKWKIVYQQGYLKGSIAPIAWEEFDQ